MKALFTVLFTLLLLPATGRSETLETPSRTHGEYALNFAAVYAAQWSVYLLTQQDAITEHGSWDNFVNYPKHPEFDKDSFDYNIFKHALSGQYYYLFYRYRGYSETEAFTWTFLSSLAFEFAVETYTEPPSIQDIYQTPVFGTLVGMGFEKASHHLRAQESVWLRTLGYVLNPFAILPNFKNYFAAVPKISADSLGLNLSWRY